MIYREGISFQWGNRESVLGGFEGCVFFIGKTSRFYFVIFPEKAEEEVWGKGKIKNNVKKFLLERKLKNLVSSNLK